MAKASKSADPAEAGAGIAPAEEVAHEESAQERKTAGPAPSIPRAPVLAAGETMDEGPEIPRAPVVAREAGTSIIVRTMRELKVQEKVKIVIPSSEMDKEPVVVSVNGYAYRIKRDEPVEVPKSIYRALLDAKLTTYTQRKREDGEGNELVASTLLRFPVSRV